MFWTHDSLLLVWRVWGGKSFTLILEKVGISSEGHHTVMPVLVDRGYAER